MVFNHHIWQDWSKSLHRWGLHHLTASFLEVSGPLALLGAQAVYLTQPVLTGFIATERLDALADMLEDGEQIREFIVYLREELPG
jgi:hypothetical protein